MTRITGLKYSRIVLALFFLGLATTAVALFGVTYLGSRSIADLEIKRQVQKEDALAQLAFTSYLGQLGTRLRALAADEALIKAITAKDQQEADRLLQTHLAAASDPRADILILNRQDELGWLDASQTLIDIGGVLPGTAMRTMAPDVWQVFSDHDSSPAAMAAVIALPVIDPSDGRVLGRLVGGSLLNDSFAVLSALSRLLDGDNLAIVHEGAVLASSGSFRAADHFDRIQELLSVQAHTVQDSRLYWKTAIFSDDHGHPIFVYSDQANTILSKVRQTCLDLFLPFVLFVGLTALFVALALNKFMEPALASLVDYARDRRNKGDLEPYKPGRIAEYNQLGYLFQEAFESVHNIHARFKDLIEGSLQGVVVHSDQKILYVNRAMLHMLGYSGNRADVLVGKPIWSLYDPCEEQRLRNYYETRNSEGSAPPVYEVRAQSKSGAEVWLEQHVRLTTWDGHEAIYLTVMDITARKEQERLIEHQSNYDLLTGLPNRNMLLDRLQQAITNSEQTGSLAALMIVDLERFKVINDTFGHEFGDRIVTTIGRRIEQVVKRTETVARLGGDEFAIIMPSADDEWEIEHRAQTILEEIARKIDVEGENDLFLTASIGITVYPYDGKDQDALMRQADAAMYQAKSEGGNRFRFFSRHMNERTARGLQLEAGLRKAIENKDLEIFVQPIIDYVSGTLVGCEALARWHDPQLGFVSPAEFIPVAEETGLIIPLGLIILRKACAFHAACREKGLDVASISVNISTRQCREADFVDCIKAILEETGMDPGHLRLEMTESVLFDDQQIDPIKLLTTLKGLGIKISLDDFGTGYSSLSYLKRLPIDILKIDRSFVMDLEKDADAQALVEAIISMAGKLGINVICEGAETQEQCDILASLGCRLIQGYYLARTMPEHEFLDFVSSKPFDNQLARKAS